MSSLLTGPARSSLRALLLANVLVVGICGSAPDPKLEAAVRQTQMLLAGANVQTLHSSSRLQNIALDAHANPTQISDTPHFDFGADPQAGKLIRRRGGADEPARRVMIAADANMGDESDEVGQKFSSREDRRFTPEALFADKKIAPEVAEFLGHLAQRSRTHRKQANKAIREAALSEGMTATHASVDEEDNSDDMEDMQRARSRAVKRTPLAHFFDAMDSKATSASWLAKDCDALSKNLTDKYMKMGGRSRATWGTAGPAGNAGRSDIHTGMFFRHWGIGQTKEANDQALRKLRLAVLSFLATQDPAKVKLHIWTDLDKHNDTIKEMLGPIAHHPELMDAINITTFDPDVELAQVPPTLARNVLAERFHKDTMPHLRADLYRSVILYNYGGLWMDADTVLMQDVAPLLGEDWAYLVKGKADAVEGSLLSVSRPRSHFATEYLISLVMRLPPMDGEVQKPLLEEIYGNDPGRTSMHALPPCFVDGEPAVATDAAVLGSDTSLGSVFFHSAVPEPYRMLFSSGIEDAMKDKSKAGASVLQDTSLAQWVQKADSDSDEDDDDEEEKPTPTSPSWAYHWRGKFGASWARGSLADVAERTFMKKLDMLTGK